MPPLDVRPRRPRVWTGSNHAKPHGSAVSILLPERNPGLCWRVPWQRPPERPIRGARMASTTTTAIPGAGVLNADRRSCVRASILTDATKLDRRQPHGFLGKLRTTQYQVHLAEWLQAPAVQPRRVPPPAIAAAIPSPRRHQANVPASLLRKQGSSPPERLGKPFVRA